MSKLTTNQKVAIHSAALEGAISNVHLTEGKWAFTASSAWVTEFVNDIKRIADAYIAKLEEELEENEHPNDENGH